MRKSSSYKSISAVAALLLLAVFSVGILGVLLSGGRIYKNLSQTSQQQYNRRTCLQYLTMKLAQSPSPDSITLEQFDGCDALAIRENGFVLRTYCYNGYLMELYSADTDGFSACDGEKILPLDSLSIQQDGSLLTFTLAEQGITCELHHRIRGYGYES